VEGDVSPEEQAADNNGAMGEATKYTARLFDDGRKVHQIRLACGHLKRVAQPVPKHLQSFIDRVFGIVGVEEK